MHKIEFDAPIAEGELTRNSVTIDYTVVRESGITIYYLGGAMKSMPLDGLTEADVAIHDGWMAMVCAITKDEYQTQDITNRHNALHAE